MDNKLIQLLAMDSMLVDLDDEYEEISKEQYDHIYLKLLESYGIKVTSSDEDREKMRKLLVKDVLEYRNQLINDL